MNKIIFVLIILLIFTPLLLVHNETFIVFNRDRLAYNKDTEVCTGDKQLDLEHVCNNTRSCCVDTNSCYCDNPLIKDCIDNETYCRKKFCKNMKEEECETFCENVKRNCCKYLKQRTTNEIIDSKFGKAEEKYSKTNKCEMSSSNIDKYSCGKVCYNDPNCTGYSISFGNTICSLYSKDNKPKNSKNSKYYARK